MTEDKIKEIGSIKLPRERFTWLAAMPFSDDDTRYNLNGVLCRPLGKRSDLLDVLFCATDGHRLAMFILGAPEVAEAKLPTEGILIPSRLITFTKKHCKVVRNRVLRDAPEAAVTVKSEGARASVEWGHAKEVRVQLAADSPRADSFPQFGNVIPSPEALDQKKPRESVAAYNGQYIADACALASKGSKFLAPIIYPLASLDGVNPGALVSEFRFGSGASHWIQTATMIQIIMPMRDDRDPEQLYRIALERLAAAKQHD